MRRGAEHGVVLLQEPGNAFQPVLRLLVALRHVSLGDAIEFRVMVEAGAARSLAAAAGAPGSRRCSTGWRRRASGSRSSTRSTPRSTSRSVRTAGNALLDLVEDAVDGLLRKIVTDLALIAWDWERSGRS